MFPKDSRAKYERLPCAEVRPTVPYETAMTPLLPPFPRISKSLEQLKPSYECVVIGSGYGGGIAASRMARSGQSLCVLERGQEKWPGEYPTGFLEAAKELHVSGKTGKKAKNGQKATRGKATGMYHVVRGKGQSAVVCHGKQSIDVKLQLRLDLTKSRRSWWRKPYECQCFSRGRRVDLVLGTMALRNSERPDLFVQMHVFSLRCFCLVILSLPQH